MKKKLLFISGFVGLIITLSIFGQGSRITGSGGTSPTPVFNVAVISNLVYQLIQVTPSTTNFTFTTATNAILSDAGKGTNTVLYGATNATNFRVQGNQTNDGIIEALSLRTTAGVDFGGIITGQTGIKLLSGFFEGSASKASNIVADNISSGTLPLPRMPITNGVLNVRLAPFNAVGDGSADDGPAISNALYTSVTTPGHPLDVYIPAGHYRIANSILLPTNATPPSWGRYTKPLKIYGEGNASVISYTNMTGAAFYHSRNASGAGGATSNYLYNFQIKDLMILGAMRLAPFDPRTTYPIYLFYTNPLYTASAITCGRSDGPPVGGASIAEKWLFENVVIAGFRNGMALSNLNYPSWKNCLIEFNAGSDILLASTFAGDIEQCQFGTGGLFYPSTEMTNEVGINLVDEGAALTHNRALTIRNCEGGYASTFIKRTGDSSFTAINCRMEAMIHSFMHVNADAPTCLINCWSESGQGPFIFVSGTANKFDKWTIMNSWGDNTKPFIIMTNDIYTDTLMSYPIIIGTRAGTRASDQFTYQYTTAFPQDQMIQAGKVGVGTNWYYLPLLNEPIAGKYQPVLGRETATLADTDGYFISTNITAGSWQIYGGRLLSVPINTGKGFYFYYNLPTEQSTKMVRIKITAISANGVLCTNSIDYGFRDNTSTTTTSGSAVDSLFVTQTGSLTTVSNVLTLANYPWRGYGQQVYVYLFVTNPIVVTDIQLGFSGDYFVPKTNSGWRLPDRDYWVP